MGTRRVSAVLAAATVLVTVALGGCGSAADIAAGRPGDQPGRHTSGPGGKQTEPSSPRKSSPTPTEKTTTAPPRRSALPRVVGAIRVFLTPSRNIGCRVSAQGARCDIRQHVYREPVRPASCRGDYGQSVAVSGSGSGEFVCVTDSVFDPGARVLRYGTSTVVGDFGCTSRITGIRCISLTSRHGFRLSQRSPALF